MFEPIIKEHDGILVVRDDYVPGGTKRCFLDKLIAPTDREIIYAGPVYGGAQIAVAHAARARGIKATLFCAKRQIKHPRTLAAQAAGATIKEVPHGYLNVVQSAAKAYARTTGAHLLPFGLDTPEAADAIEARADAVIGLIPPVDQVWCVGGSGTLARALRRAIPDVELHVVQVGREISVPGAFIHIHPLKFEQDARLLPPFPSCSNYDAKGWEFVLQSSRGRVLFWNVMSNGEPTT